MISIGCSSPQHGSLQECRIRFTKAASFGLPVVATELLRHQLGWEHGRELLAAEATDPAAFARHVVALQKDEGLWHHVRESALHRLRHDNNRETYAAAIREVLGKPQVDG